MRTILIAVTCLALCGCGSGQRLPADAKTILEKADEIELYSLNPDKRARKEGTGLRGWEVYGSAKLSGADKQKVIKALQRGLANSDGSVAACFNPRHGIAATHDGKKIELVICYECHSMHGYLDSSEFTNLTARGPEGEFNAILTDKSIKVAEK